MTDLQTLFFLDRQPRWTIDGWSPNTRKKLKLPAFDNVYSVPVQAA